MSGFDDFVASQSSGSGGANVANTGAGGSFSSNQPHPFLTGVSNNVAGGNVIVGHDPSFIDNPHGTFRPGPSQVSYTDSAVSVGAAAQALYGLSKPEISGLQQRLVNAGYLDPKDIVAPGVADSATAKAYGDLLQDSSAYASAGQHYSVDDVLSMRTQSRQASGLGTGPGGGAGSIRQGRIQAVTSPGDLANTLQDVAQSRLGRKLKQSEVSKFISLYHGLEQHQNSQELTASAAADTGANSTLTQTESAGNAAQDYVGSNMAAEAGAHDVAGQFSNFLSIIKGI